MTVKDLNGLIGDEDQTVVLIGSVGWIMSCPAIYIPNEYLGWNVTSIIPDEFDGEGFGDGVVLKIWINEYE